MDDQWGDLFSRVVDYIDEQYRTHETWTENMNAEDIDAQLPPGAAVPINIPLLLSAQATAHQYHNTFQEAHDRYERLLARLRRWSDELHKLFDPPSDEMTRRDVIFKEFGPAPCYSWPLGEEPACLRFAAPGEVEARHEEYWDVESLLRGLREVVDKTIRRLQDFLRVTAGVEVEGRSLIHAEDRRNRLLEGVALGREIEMNNRKRYLCVEELRAIRRIYKSDQPRHGQGEVQEPSGFEWLRDDYESDGDDDEGNEGDEGMIELRRRMEVKRRDFEARQEINKKWLAEHPPPKATTLTSEILTFFGAWVVIAGVAAGVAFLNVAICILVGP